MSKMFIPAALLAASAAVFSCTSHPQEPAQKPLTIGHLTFKKSDGKDCDKPDSLRTNCAQIDLSWPEVKDGNDLLKKSVSEWANKYLAGILSFPSEDSTAVLPTTVEAGAKDFFKMHAEWTKDAEDSPMGNYDAESTDTVLLNDGKYLTLFINSFVYSGGAHGSPTVAVRTFDVATGKALTWADMVTDTAAVKALAEKKFKAERADLFKPGEDGTPAFQFDETFPFALPMEYGLTSKGLFLYYQHYEVTPYAFGATPLDITFEELGALRKK